MNRTFWTFAGAALFATAALFLGYQWRRKKKNFFTSKPAEDIICLEDYLDLQDAVFLLYDPSQNNQDVLKHFQNAHLVARQRLEIPFFALNADLHGGLLRRFEISSDSLPVVVRHMRIQDSAILDTELSTSNMLSLAAATPTIHWNMPEEPFADDTTGLELEEVPEEQKNVLTTC